MQDGGTLLSDEGPRMSVDSMTGKVLLVTGAVRYLSSDEARFAVGTTLILDGGFTAM